MTPSTKKIVLYSTLLLAGLSIWMYSEYQKIKAVFDKMTISPANFKNFRIEDSNIKFDMDVLLTNPTATDFFVTGGMFADLKQITLYYNKTYMGTASVSINEVSVPHNQSIQISNIPVQLPIINALQNIAALTDLSALWNGITVTGIVNVLGTNYDIGTP